jgi:hypothetical protein
MFYATGKTAALWHYGLGGALGGIGGIAFQMLVDADLRNEVFGTMTAPNAPVHPQAIQDAAKIAPLLRHLDPQKARIAVGGIPRAGKSELSSTLAKQLGMRHYLGDVSLDMGGKVPEGSVAEGHRLLLQEDPEQFDALVHIRRPDTESRYSSPSLAWIDAPAMDAANKRQFEAARGRILRPTANAQVKLKPEGGFGTKALDESFIRKDYVAKKVLPGLLGTAAGLIATHLLRR